MPDKMPSIRAHQMLYNIELDSKHTNNNQSTMILIITD